MPIQFRCQSCRQKLAISRRKAGQVVACPACAADARVPTLEDAIATGQLIESPIPVEPSPPSPSESPLSNPSAQERSFPETATPESIVRQTDAVPSPERHRFTRDAEREEDEEEGFHLSRRPADESGLDMTPMVDITFLLLIFFMITASFSIQKSMETEAPEPDENKSTLLPSMDDLADDSIIVEIDEQDVMFVDDAFVESISQLASVLEAKIASEQKLEMIIKPHPQAKHGTVVQVTDIGIGVGMQRIRRVIQKAE